MKKYLSPLLISLSLIFTSFMPVPAMAINVFQNCPGGGAGGATTGGGASSSAGQSQICGATGDSFTSIMTNIINMILFVLGIVAVIMIIIGGIRYTTSNGDSQQIKSAKDTVLYAVIGLVVAIMAYAIVNFVLARLKGN
ncbi:MAG: hypothetical protein H6797_05860 [Candidatus Nomurabacteria bacterium]|nr:MAG: hypothetical protein H6797_05860 [Candidatus Nomurabacteria bacterium]